MIYIAEDNSILLDLKLNLIEKLSFNQEKPNDIEIKMI